MIGLYLAMLDEPDDNVDFNVIYNACKNKMFSMAYRIIGNHHDAEEAVSQAFFAVARNFSRIRGKSKQEQLAYINVATKNAAYDICRKNKAATEFVSEETDIIADGKTDVSDEVLSEIGYNRVLEAIKSLPERYAQVLYLQSVLELSTKDIARSINESEANVRKLLSRAKAKLRSILDEQGITI